MLANVHQREEGSGRRAAWATVRRLWRAFRWPLIGSVAILALVLGFSGFDAYLQSRGVARSFWDKLYLAVQLFVLEAGAVDPPVPWQLQGARFLAPLITVVAALGAILAIFRDQIAAATVRWFASNHVIVCGLGRTGRLIATGFTARGNRVVAIEANRESSAIVECREAGATVFVGDARDRSSLERARVERARYLFAVSGDDGANAEVAIAARGLVRNRRGAPLTCFVRVLDADLAGLLEAEMAAQSSITFRLELLNPAERGAPALLNEFPAFDSEGQTPFGRPHVLVVGLGQMGGRLLLHATRRWRAIVGGDGNRLRVTVVDSSARARIESLHLADPDLANVCELVSQQLDVNSPEFERGAFLLDREGRHVTAAYVCLADDARGLAAALRLQGRLKRLAGIPVPIVVRTKHPGGLATLAVNSGGSTQGLHAFELLELTCSPDVLLMGRTEVLARAVHDEYVREQSTQGHTPADNPSMVVWEELPEHLRESNRRQADDIANKVRTIGCTLVPIAGDGTPSFRLDPVEIELLARMEHARWWAERASDGWTRSAERDVQRKESPYLVPWEELPDDVKEHDRSAVRQIPTFLASAGLGLVRLRHEGGAGQHASP